jgi:hypothetical protein
LSVVAVVVAWTWAAAEVAAALSLDPLVLHQRNHFQ